VPLDLLGCGPDAAGSSCAHAVKGGQTLQYGMKCMLDKQRKPGLCWMTACVGCTVTSMPSTLCRPVGVRYAQGHVRLRPREALQSAGTAPYIRSVKYLANMPHVGVK
jgi:hypothetical protein